MGKSIKIWAAMPCLNEFEIISETLNCIQKQTYKNLSLVVCVNQPEHYHLDKKYSTIIENNKNTIRLLESINNINIQIIDKSSLGHGWDGKKAGVGWARKTLFDTICNQAEEDDIIISLDADIQFSDTYFTSIVDAFKEFPNATGISVPYFHNLSGNESLDRLILRYEIYMRYFLINLMRINSPFNFTALGSAIAFPVSIYRKLRGLTAKHSGEDFYLLQKLRKNGRILNWLDETIYPAVRLSDRVNFGTGPAMIQGNIGNWKSYPIYDFSIFNLISDTYQKFSLLYTDNLKTTFDGFLQNQQRIEPHLLWEILRRNQPDCKRFVHACHTKIDALRILQFIKYTNKENTNNIGINDESNLKKFFEVFYPQFFHELNSFSFQNSSLSHFENIRNILYMIETEYRKKENNENKLLNNLKAKDRWKYLSS